MNIERKNQVTMIVCTITSLLKEFDFGLEVYKDGSLVFTDIKNGGGYKIDGNQLQDIYDKTII